MMPLTFHIGDKPVVTTTFTDAAGVPTNPSTLVAKVEKPDGTETPITPTPGATGVYTTTLPTLDQSGTWYWRVAGTAGIIAADEGSFHVRTSPFGA